MESPIPSVAAPSIQAPEARRKGAGVSGLNDKLDDHPSRKP